MSKDIKEIGSEKELVPELRFREFEETWNNSKFGDVNQVLDSLHQTPKEYIEKGYAMIRVTDVNDGNLNIDKCLKVSEEIFIEFTKRHIPRKDDIIMSRVGTCGAAIKLNTNESVCLGQNTVLLIPEIEKSFVFIFMKSRFFQNQVSRMVVGSTQKTLSLRDLKIFNFNLPSLPEQKKIASFLSAIDQKIQQLSRKKELLEEYKKGLMQQLFRSTGSGQVSGELRFRPDSQTGSDDEGKGYPDWEERRLGEVLSIKCKKYNPISNDDNPKCIELEHLSQETGQLIGFVDGRGQKSLKSRFNKGEVLFGKLRPYLKKFLFTTFSGVCSTEIWVIKGETIINKFIFYLVQTDFFNNLANISAGSKMPRADWKVVSEGNFKFPNSNEQKKIATFLSSVDKKIKTISTQITKTQTFKKGLLQQMFV